MSKRDEVASRRGTGVLLRVGQGPLRVSHSDRVVQGKVDDLLSVASEDAVYVGRGVLPVAYAGFKVGFRVGHSLASLVFGSWDGRPVLPGGYGGARAAAELQQLQVMKSRARAAKERGATPQD